ncbi:MAG: hypothetical protein ABFD92_10390 [Planctomycetaceae bacterium]|nr:hypothetical protein [Planctomycetaceae bacterium]
MGGTPMPHSKSMGGTPMPHSKSMGGTPMLLTGETPVLRSCGGEKP